MSNENSFEVGGRISAEPLTRNLQTMTVYVHEILDIRQEIKKGVPLSWGLRLFWSTFCLCCGNILSNALTQENFNLIKFILGLSSFMQAMLVVSFLGSLLLLFIGKAKGSSIDRINQILKQHGVT